MDAPGSTKRSNQDLYPSGSNMPIKQTANDLVADLTWADLYTANIRQDMKILIRTVKKAVAAVVETMEHAGFSGEFPPHHVRALARNRAPRKSRRPTDTQRGNQKNGQSSDRQHFEDHSATCAVALEIECVPLSRGLVTGSGLSRSRLHQCLHRGMHLEERALGKAYARAFASAPRFVPSIGF